MRSSLFTTLLCSALLGATAARANIDFGKIIDAVSDNKDNAAKIVKGATGIGPAEEQVIGDSVALEIAGRYNGLVRDEEVSTRVNLIGQTLARSCDRPEMNWRFAVLDDKSINAFSAPDGYVFITRGLYDLARTDDQLAGVIAHEIAHITGRHALKIVARGAFLSGAAGIASNNVTEVAQADELLRAFDSGVGKITTTLFEKGFDAKTEYDADKRARDLCLLTGYAPGALRAMLLTLKAQGIETKKVFPTHPSIDNRVKRLPNDPAPAAASETT